MADEVVQTTFGKFLITRGDLIGETTRAGTLWDGPGFLQPIALEHGRLGDVGQVILDVGANQGMFSVWLAQQGAWRVVAVEPVPQVMQRLKANLDLNQATCADRVVTLEVAGYDREIALFAPPLDPGNWGGTTLRLTQAAATVFGRLVRGQPLDIYRFLYGAGVSLIKVDAQGCDGRVLQGLEYTIRTDHPAIVFEWEEALALAHGQCWFDIKYWLNTHGYSVYEWPSQPNNFLALWKGQA